MKKNNQDNENKMTQSSAIRRAARAATDKSLTADALAMLAAVSVRGTKVPARDAVCYAYELWSEARALLSPDNRYRHELARHGVVTSSQRFDDVTQGAPMPGKFPANFDDFLRLVVKARTRDDGVKRFRDFAKAELKRQGQNEDGYDVIMARQKKTAYDQLTWKLEARAYLAWWKSQKSQQAKNSAAKSIDARRQQKN